MKILPILLLLSYFSFAQDGTILSLDLTKTIFHETSVYLEKDINDKFSHEIGLGVNLASPFLKGFYHEYTGDKKFYYTGGTFRYGLKKKIFEDKQKFLNFVVHARYLGFKNKKFCWGYENYCWEDNAVSIKQNGKRLEVGLSLNYSSRDIWKSGHEFFIGLGGNAINEQVQDVSSANEDLYRPNKSWRGEWYIRPMFNFGFKINLKGY